MSFVDSSTYYVWDAQDHLDLLPSSVDEAASILSQCLNIEAEVKSDNVLRFAEDLEKKARSGEFDGELSIIDFKTSTKSRNDDWNYNYYVQASAYAEMYEERMGTPIEQIVILVVTDDGTVQEFVKEKEQMYLDTLTETLDMFHKSML